MSARASDTVKPPRFGTGAIWLIPPVLAIAAVFLYPLTLILRQAFSDADNALSLGPIGELVTSALFQRALLNTIEIAAASTAGCLIVGFVLALALFFVPFPGSRFVARLIDTVIALPTFLITLAFTFIYGSSGLLNGALVETFHLAAPPIDFLYSAWGVILAEITVFTPFIMRPLMAAFSLIEPSQIEVASSLGARPLLIVRRIVLPAALPALLAGGSLCLLLTINEFGIVLFIGAKGVTTLPLLVYDKAIQEGDYATACACAVINIVLSLGLFGLYRTVIARLGGRHAGLV